LENGYKLDWKDIVVKPSNEFFSRFFAGEGYKDGLHGLALSFLQSFSEMAIYLKIWEKQGFEEQKIESYNNLFIKISNDLFFWLQKISHSLLGKIRLKLRRII
jgi:(heptosyl)LPS beta-1,4-glucosyltransferase